MKPENIKKMNSKALLKAEEKSRDKVLNFIFSHAGYLGPEYDEIFDEWYLITSERMRRKLVPLHLNKYKLIIDRILK